MKTAEELPDAQRSPLTATAPGMPSPAVRALVEEIAIELPGCSDVEIRKALQRCAREFCDRTNCWCKDVEFGPCGPMGAYPVLPVTGATFLRVREKMGLWLRPGEDGWAGLPGPQPLLFPGKLRPHLGVPPDGQFVAALAPEIGGEDLPDEIVARWGDAIASGARAHLAVLPGRPWSDPQGAVVYGQKYNAGMCEARAQFELKCVPSHLQTRSKVPFVI